MPTPIAGDAVGPLLSFMDALRGDMQAGLPDNCSFMHIKALDQVARLGEPSMSEVAGSLKITSPGATLVVDKLVENGELDRRPDADDRRIVRLAVTGKGRATLAAGMKTVAELISRRLSALNKAEHRQLRLILEKLAAPDQ